MAFIDDSEFDPFRDIVLLELGLRGAVMTVADVGYDGDPNSGSAPLVLQNARIGAMYRRETPDVVFYRRVSALWAVIGVEQTGLTTTLTSLEYPLNPSSTAFAPRTPTGTVFTQQLDIDDYLSSNGADSFEYLSDIAETIPFVLSEGHAVTINLGGGVIRPRLATEYDGPMFGFYGIQLTGSSISLLGDSNKDNWTVVHAGGTIQSHSTASPDPYVECSPGTFPADGSLRNSMAIWGDAFGIVVEHTDSRLYLTRVGTAPTNGVTTVQVKKPNTILRVSRDDTTREHNKGVINISPIISSGEYKQNTPSDLLIEDYGTGTPIKGTKVFMFNQSVILDKKAGPLPENGGGWRGFGKGTVFFIEDCAFNATPLGGADAGVEALEGADMRLTRTAIEGADDGGLYANDSGRIWLNGCSIRGCSGNTNAAVYCETGGYILGINTSGLKNIIQDTPAGFSALRFNGPHLFPHFLTWIAVEIRFKNNAGPCVEVLDNVQLFMNGSGNKFTDAGGNTDVGIKISGRRSDVALDPTTNVTGSGGDVEIEGAAPVTYGSLPTEAAATATPKLNFVSQG